MTGGDPLMTGGDPLVTGGDPLMTDGDPLMIECCRLVSNVGILMTDGGAGFIFGGCFRAIDTQARPLNLVPTGHLRVCRGGFREGRGEGGVRDWEEPLLLRECVVPVHAVVLEWYLPPMQEHQLAYLLFQLEPTPRGGEPQ
jgi:hypothetical protein